MAGWLAVSCFRPSFDFDDFIKRFAVRASEWIECTSCHDTPPILALPHRKREQERSHTLLYVGIFGCSGEVIANQAGRGAFLIMTENK